MKPPINQFAGQILLWISVAVVLVLLYQSLSPKLAGTQQQMSYSEFVQQVKNDNVESITASPSVPTVVTGKLKDGNTLRTVLPVFGNEQLQPLLDAHQVKTTQKPGDNGFSLWRLLLDWGPILIFIAIMIWFMRQMQQGAGGRGAMSFGRSRAKLQGEDQIKVTFADVAGCEEAKEEVSELVDFLRDPSKFTKLGGKIPRGVLMLGSPGVGKTLLAKAIAGEAKVPFFSISGSDFVEMFVGVGAARVRDMFEQAKKNSPCIIFIDEIDAVGRQRGAGLGGGNDEREQTLNQLLVEMDGFESNEGVILIAATNRPDVLDPALLRPGRFDRQIVVDRPDVRGREGILKVHARKVPLKDDVNLTTMAKGTPGLAGADLANLVNEAALLAARRNKQKVGMSEFEEARDKVLMGTARKSLLLTEDDKRITAYYKAGHALISKLLPQADPLHKVTIIPRGRALGLTWQLPEDKVHQSRSRLLAELRVLYGGREAERLVFDDITTGAANDIKRATQIAEAMVCDVGMSEALGLRNYGKKQEEIFIGREIAQHRDFSERTAELIDSEINRILEEARLETARLLRDNRDKLDLLAEALLIHEILDADEIVRILKGEILAAPVRVPEPASPAGEAEEDGPGLPGPELEPLGQPGVA